MSTDRIPMSKEGYDKLKAQLDTMKNEDMPRIAEQIAQARGYGDLSENAEFDAAVEAQGMLQARINELQDKLARGMIVDRSTLPTDRVVFGSDYPHPEGLADPVSYAEELDSLPREDIEKIMGGNLAEALKIAA